jgi:hypothetical protein
MLIGLERSWLSVFCEVFKFEGAFHSTGLVFFSWFRGCFLDLLGSTSDPMRRLSPKKMNTVVRQFIRD